jgi:hypothetical protein
MYAWSSINNTKKADETIYLRRVIGRFSLSFKIHRNYITRNLEYHK